MNPKLVKLGSAITGTGTSRVELSLGGERRLLGKETRAPTLHCHVVMFEDISDGLTK